jgi:uncharacterized protein YndB with AHSA1/START domain
MIAHNQTKIDAIPGRQEILITREFNAPRELVFKAYTDPQLYTQWIGPRELRTTIITFDPKQGGKYRYIQRDKNGHEFAFHGVFHEVKSPERIIETFEYEGLPEQGHAALDTVKFESLPGNRTMIVEKTVFLSIEDRDGMIQADMERGINESYERLDELLENSIKTKTEK